MWNLCSMYQESCLQSWNNLDSSVSLQGLAPAAIACPLPLAVRPTTAPDRCSQPTPSGGWKDEVRLLSSKRFHESIPSWNGNILYWRIITLKSSYWIINLTSLLQSTSRTGVLALPTILILGSPVLGWMVPLSTLCWPDRRISVRFFFIHETAQNYKV